VPVSKEFDQFVKNPDVSAQVRVLDHIEGRVLFCATEQSRETNTQRVTGPEFRY
jgi:hypothetical protein